MAKFCSECGQAVEATERFCTSCGSRTFNDAPSAPAAAPAPVATPTVVPAPVAAAPTVAPAPSAATSATRSGVPFGRPIFVALVWGAFAAGAGWLYERSVSGALNYFIAGAVVTFAVLVVLGAIRAVLTAPFRRRAVAAGGGIGLGLIVLTLLGGAVVASTAFVVGPDLPPGLLDPERIAERVTSLLPAAAAERAVPAEKRVSTRDARIPTPPTSPPDPAKARAQTALQQLRAAGVNASAVGIVEMPSGQKVMTVGVDAFALGGPDLNGALNALVKMAQANAFDLSGVDAVSVGVHDRDGRVLFAMAASTKEIESFRTGKATRREFIRGVALRTESKIGVLNAARELVAK